MKIRVTHSTYGSIPRIRAACGLPTGGPARAGHNHGQDPRKNIQAVRLGLNFQQSDASPIPGSSAVRYVRSPLERQYL
jgi:hypothetical protein